MDGKARKRLIHSLLWVFPYELCDGPYSEGEGEIESSALTLKINIFLQWRNGGLLLLIMQRPKNQVMLYRTELHSIVMSLFSCRK